MGACVTIEIVQAQASDLGSLLEVNLQAFGPEEGPTIVELIKNILLDSSAKPCLSLVAKSANNLIGHILFSKAYLVSQQGESISTALLAPMAVKPEFSNQGIGKQLIKVGFKQLKQQGVELVLVLGHPEYYPKAGFINNAIEKGVSAPFAIEERNHDAWMYHELLPNCLDGFSGQLKCCDSLNQAEYWQE